MELTRVPTKKVKQAVATATKKLEEAREALEDVLVALSDKERESIPRVRTKFPAAARDLAKESAGHPDLVKAVGYDADAIVEDLDNVESLEGLSRILSRIQQLIDDSTLAWSAEAYVPSLQLYGVAKVRASVDGKLAQAIAPMAEVFASPRKRKALPPEK